MAYVYAYVMRPPIDMERGGELHQRVEAYAEEHGLRQPRAYAELIERGLDAAESEVPD